MLSRPSPNHNARPAKIRLVVLHCDASPSEDATLNWLANPKSQVSYHVLIGRDGTMYRIVEDNRRAWHAGKSAWRGVPDVNGVSLGVAMSNRQDGKEPITPAQADALRTYLRDVKMKYPSIEAVTTHKACARPVGRKCDPDKAPNWLDIARTLSLDTD